MDTVLGVGNVHCLQYFCEKAEATYINDNDKIRLLWAEVNYNG